VSLGDVRDGGVLAYLMILPSPGLGELAGRWATPGQAQVVAVPSDGADRLTDLVDECEDITSKVVEDMRGVGLWPVRAGVTPATSCRDLTEIRAGIDKILRGADAPRWAWEASLELHELRQALRALVERVDQAEPTRLTPSSDHVHVYLRGRCACGIDDLSSGPLEA